MDSRHKTCSSCDGSLSRGRFFWLLNNHTVLPSIYLKLWYLWRDRRWQDWSDWVSALSRRRATLILVRIFRETGFFGDQKFPLTPLTMTSPCAQPRPVTIYCYIPIAISTARRNWQESQMLIIESALPHGSKALSQWSHRTIWKFDSTLVPSTPLRSVGHVSLFRIFSGLSLVRFLTNEEYDAILIKVYRISTYLKDCRLWNQIELAISKYSQKTSS